MQLSTSCTISFEYILVGIEAGRVSYSLPLPHFRFRARVFFVGPILMGARLYLSHHAQIIYIYIILKVYFECIKLKPVKKKKV